MPSLVRMIVREEAKVVGWMMTRLLMMVQDSGYFIMKLRTYLHKKFNVSKSKQQRGVWGFRLKMRMLCENRSKEDFWYFLTVPMKGWKRDHFRLQISSSLCWGKSKIKMKLFHAQPKKGYAMMSTTKTFILMWENYFWDDDSWCCYIVCRREWRQLSSSVESSMTVCYFWRADHTVCSVPKSKSHNNSRR